MAKLHPIVSFQYKGRIVKSGELVGDAVLTVPLDDLKKEKAKGKNKETGNWLSPLLNHCEPADNEAAKVFGVDQVEREEEKDDTKEIEQVQAEFDKIGKAYDKRWKLPRLKNELLKAQKEIGV